MGAITLYCGLSDSSWNGVAPDPGPFCCISPVYGSSAAKQKKSSVKVPPKTRVIQDSGAFSDNWADRLTFERALERQQKHAAQYRYEGQITYRASYDLLIDEKWEEGKRRKERWTEEEAWKAVDTTVKAAEFLTANRGGAWLGFIGAGCFPLAVPAMRQADRATAGQLSGYSGSGRLVHHWQDA